MNKRLKHHMLRKAALVAITITSVAATSGVADAGFKPITKEVRVCIASENAPGSQTATSQCPKAPAMIRGGIRW